MGNSFSPCVSGPEGRGGVDREAVRLVFWGGATRLLREPPQPAGRLMLDFPDHVICHADSFYVGQPVPSLGARDELLAGNTYFVIPVRRLPYRLLSAASLSTLISADRARPRVGFGKGSFQCVKNADGRKMIQVVPEYMNRIVSQGGGDRRGRSSGVGGNYGTLCTTRELRKHYAGLVGPRERLWSPKLATIPERKACSQHSTRDLGLEYRR